MDREAGAADLEPGEEALDRWGDIFEQNPSDVRAANLVGRSLEHLGRVEEAQAHWDLVLEIQPQNMIARRRADSLRHRRRRPPSGEGTPLTEPGEVRAFYLATTGRMRLFLDELARQPGVRRTNPQIESALGWAPLSVRGTAAGSARRIGDRFGFRSPYHWAEGNAARSGRFETWMDEGQAAAVRAARGSAQTTTTS